MLSRVVSLDGLGILRPFNESVLRWKPCKDVLDELARLKEAALNTEQQFRRMYGDM